MPPASPHVLVIEADDDLCAFFAALLSSEGYIVNCVPSAEAVHELLATTRPNLVISNLGFGQGGLADFCLLALLDSSEKHHGLPVLFCTAWDEQVMTPQVAALGRPHTALLAMPFDIEVLLEAIDRGCGGRPMTPAPRIAIDFRQPLGSGTRRVQGVMR
jgi:DNA-binding response OmpR family regulator